ncbi:MAG: hypothetical protein EP338_06890 [Bacteroidetes bacterium]|nr:MAG: hypothetical protein EP338_06890 [Bacteroidota bacterium]
MKAQLIIFAALLSLLSSCKKEKTEPICTPAPQEDYFPNKAGSYWTYQWYSIDSNGVETAFGSLDSIYISGDTSINNQSYTIYKGRKLGNNNYTSLLRDSSGYIVSPQGFIHYSYTNFTDTLQQGVSAPWNWYLKMFQESLDLFGATKEALKARTYYYDPSGNPINNCGDTYFTFNSWYVSGIGKVKETNAFANQLQNCGLLEARLVSYHIGE